jgi:hypothetical protein
MSQADRAFDMGRADEEQARAERAVSPEARSAYQQLCDMYRIRAGHLVEGSGITVLAGGKAQ